ncbi:MAG: hypothetical protein KDD66_02885 [Bdellovibrionales bacterium]|nr:hypothetical protein [Bdellovibrionales bacterium]
MNWNSFWSWIVSAFHNAEPLLVIVAIELFAVFLAQVIHMFFARLTLMRHHKELLGKVNNDEVENQLVWVTDDNVLLISQIPHGTSVPQLFFPNTAVQKELKRICGQASWSEPVIPFTDQNRGILERLFNNVAEHNRAAHGEVRPWLVIPTYWDLPEDRTCIRMLVVSPEQLEKFIDWEWCKTVKVEGRTHWSRIIVLHRAALYYFHLEKGREDGRARRIGRMRLTIRTDDEPLRVNEIDWTGCEQREMMSKVGLAA